LQDNYPFRVFLTNVLMHENTFHGVQISFNNCFAKKNIVSEMLDSMHECQSQLFDVRVVQFCIGKSLAKVVYDIPLMRVILLNQKYPDGAF